MKLDSVQEKAKEQFGRQSDRYAKGHILHNVSDVEAGLSKITLPKKARVLDVATGAGNTGIYLATLGHEVTITDIAEPMLKHALQSAAEKGVSVTSRVHPAEEFPFPDTSFDLVTCRVAAHHFSSPEKFVSEVSRVLQSGGHFLLIDGTVDDGNPEAEEWSHQVEKLRDPSHHRFISPKKWKDMCEANGLRVLQSEIFPFKMPDLNWYFETAGTAAQNREQVLELVEKAPESAKNLFRLTREAEKIVWWWQRLTLVAQRQ